MKSVRDVVKALPKDRQQAIAARTKDLMNGEAKRRKRKKKPHIPVATDYPGANTKGAVGFRETVIKVVVGWTPPLFEYINRKAMERGTSFAKEARRLVGLGIENDFPRDSER